MSKKKKILLMPMNDSLVLPDIIIRAIGVEELETLETRYGHVLLIFSPRDALGFQQINNGGNVGRDIVQVVVVHSKVVPSN